MVPCSLGFIWEVAQGTVLEPMLSTPGPRTSSGREVAMEPGRWELLFVVVVGFGTAAYRNQAAFWDKAGLGDSDCTQNVRDDHSFTFPLLSSPRFIPLQRIWSPLSEVCECGLIDQGRLRFAGPRF